MLKNRFTSYNENSSQLYIQKNTQQIANKFQDSDHRRNPRSIASSDDEEPWQRSFSIFHTVPKLISS